VTDDRRRVTSRAGERDSGRARTIARVAFVVLIERAGVAARGSARARRRRLKRSLPMKITIEKRPKLALDKETVRELLKVKSNVRTGYTPYSVTACPVTDSCSRVVLHV
jgi:hypothetical protein